MKRVLVFALAVALLGACASERPSSPTTEGSETPSYEFETFEGEAFALAEQRGTPVVLNFWESW